MCYLLQGIYDLIARKYCYPPCCNSFCYWGLNVLVLSSSNFWACATSLHLGWHAHPGNGSAGKSNHITTSPETSADCLKIVLGLTEGMGEAIRYAAHNAPASQVPVATHASRCVAHKTAASQVPVARRQRASAAASSSGTAGAPTRFYAASNTCLDLSVKMKPRATTNTQKSLILRITLSPNIWIAFGDHPLKL